MGRDALRAVDSLQTTDSYPMSVKVDRISIRLTSTESGQVVDRSNPDILSTLKNVKKVMNILNIFLVPQGTVMVKIYFHLKARKTTGF